MYKNNLIFLNKLNNRIYINSNNINLMLFD